MSSFNSMKYNFADSFLRVVLVLCLLRFFGMESYVWHLVFQHHLQRGAEPPPAAESGPGAGCLCCGNVALPLGCAALAVTAGKAALQGIAFSPAPVEAAAAHGGFGGAVRRAVWVPLLGGRKMERHGKPGKQAVAASSLGK